LQIGRDRRSQRRAQRLDDWQKMGRTANGENLQHRRFARHAPAVRDRRLVPWLAFGGTQPRQSLLALSISSAQSRKASAATPSGDTGAPRSPRGESSQRAGHRFAASRLRSILVELGVFAGVPDPARRFLLSAFQAAQNFRFPKSNDFEFPAIPLRPDPSPDTRMSRHRGQDANWRLRVKQMTANQPGGDDTCHPAAL
jgi:hypothetical protein